MKALYDKYFQIPKQGKICDKVMLSHVVMTAVLMIVYLLSISVSAYAFFSAEIQVHNTLETANFEAKVQILGSEGDEIELDEDGCVSSAVLDVGTYDVYLRHGGTAETGFCVMEVCGENIDTGCYHTAQLGVSQTAENGYNEAIVFALEIYEPAEVIFISHWGTSSYYSAFTAGETSSCYIMGGEYIGVGDPENTWRYLEEETEEPEEEMFEAPVEELEELEEEFEEAEEEMEEPIEEPAEEHDLSDETWEVYDEIIPMEK